MAGGRSNALRLVKATSVVLLGRNEAANQWPSAISVGIVRYFFDASRSQIHFFALQPAILYRPGRKSSEVNGRPIIRNLLLPAATIYATPLAADMRQYFVGVMPPIIMYPSQKGDGTLCRRERRMPAKTETSSPVRRECPS